MDRRERPVRETPQEPGEPLPGQPGQLVGQLAWFEGRRSSSHQPTAPSAMPTIAAARAEPSGARPASAAMIRATRAATQRRNSVTCRWKSASRPRASVNSSRRPRGGRRSRGRPEPAPQPLLVVLGLAEGGLQLLGEPAQVVGQQCRVAPAWRSAGRGRAWSPRRPRRWTPWRRPGSRRGRTAAWPRRGAGPAARPPAAVCPWARSPVPPPCADLLVPASYRSVGYRA